MNDNKDYAALIERLTHLITTAQRRHSERVDAMYDARAAIASLKARAEKAEARALEYEIMVASDDAKFADLNAALSAARADFARKDEALAPFAKRANKFEADNAGPGQPRVRNNNWLVEVSIGDCLHARAARSPSPEPKEGAIMRRPPDCVDPQGCTWHRLETEPPTDYWVCNHPDCNHAIVAAGADTDPPAPERTSPNKRGPGLDEAGFMRNSEGRVHGFYYLPEPRETQPAASSAGAEPEQPIDIMSEGPGRMGPYWPRARPPSPEPSEASAQSSDKFVRQAEADTARVNALIAAGAPAVTKAEVEAALQEYWKHYHSIQTRDLLRLALIAAARARPSPEGEWQPIETAPRMQTVLLFAVTSIDPPNWQMETGFWHSGFGDTTDHKMSAWNWGGRQLYTYDTQPTHWRPLPAPPAIARAQGGKTT